jgi:hypothetical protein
MKPVVEEEDFEITPEKKMSKRAVNFKVAPEGYNLTTHRCQVAFTGKISRCSEKKKKPQKQKELSKKAFEKVLEEVKRQDSKLQEVNKTIAVTIKMLQEQLTKRITKLQRELHEIIRSFKTRRLKATIPLRTTDFQRDVTVISWNIDEIGDLYDQLDLKCGDWKQNIIKHNIDYYTFPANNDTSSKPFYVDPLGYTDVMPPDDSNDYYEACPVHVNRPSCHRRCQFIGRHHRCPSPRKRNSHQNAIHTMGSFKQETDIQHGNFDEDYHQAARKKSEEIFRKTWKDKGRIRASSQYNTAPFTRIERAFMASAISMTTDRELEQDEEKAKVAAIKLKLQMTNIDADDRIKAQQLQIETLTRELEDLQKDRQFCTPSVTSHHSDPAVEPPTVILTSTITQDISIPVPGEISYTMNALLEIYETLDEDSKNELLKYAISSGNENLQSCLLMLHQNKTGTSLAKLTKDLIKLADSYEVPDLKFDKQASKQQFNFHTWIMKIQPILAMFPKTASVLPNDKVIPLPDPHTAGNRALYFLISSRTDSYFQRVIKQFEPFSDGKTRASFTND